MWIVTPICGVLTVAPFVPLVFPIVDYVSFNRVISGGQFNRKCRFTVPIPRLTYSRRSPRAYKPIWYFFPQLGRLTAPRSGRRT